MNKKAKSAKQESTVAKYLGWQVVSGSGSRPFHVGDILCEEWLGECKTHVTSKHNIVFDLHVLNKIHDEATSKHRFPVLIVDDGSQEIEHTWCCVPILPWASTAPSNTSTLINSNQSSITIRYSDSLELSDKEVYKIKSNTRPLYVMSLLKFKMLIEDE